MKLDKAIKKSSAENSSLDLFSLETFENIAYLMEKHADPGIPDTAEEWLEDFNAIPIYNVLPAIIELWGVNLEIQSTAKNNQSGS